MEEKTTEKTKPVYEVKSGPIRASIWRKNGKNGPWHEVSFGRLYTEDDGKTFKSANSFGEKHMAHLGQVLKSANEWLAMNDPR